MMNAFHVSIHSCVIHPPQMFTRCLQCIVCVGIDDIDAVLVYPVVLSVNGTNIEVE